MAKTIIILTAASTAAIAAANARHAREANEIKDLETKIGPVDHNLLPKCLLVSAYPSASSAVEEEGKPGFFEGWLTTYKGQQRIEDTKETIKQCLDANLLKPVDQQGHPVEAKSGVVYEPLVNFNCNLTDICTPATRHGAQESKTR